MGIGQSKLKGEEISLIVLSSLIVCFIVAVGVIFGIKPTQPTSAPTPRPTSAPTFTHSPTAAPTFTAAPTRGPTSAPTIAPTSAPTPPHLTYDPNLTLGPSNVPLNFYRKGCAAALTELFPFSSFNTTGTFHSGNIQDYYTYDTWGYSGGTDKYDCGFTIINGKNVCPPDPKPNIPWTDQQCDICATASQDPNCKWTQHDSNCYTDYLGGIQYVPSYKGLDISSCWYNPIGNFNAKKLCCNPAIA